MSPLLARVDIIASVPKTVRLLVIVGLPLATVLVLGALVVSASRNDQPSRPQCGPEGTIAPMTLTEARRFGAFDVFYAGLQVLHLRLSSVGCTMAPAVDKPVLSREPESFGVTPSWGFTYGTCNPGGGEGGCADPVDIQENESCWANLSGYAGNSPRLRLLRGVPSTRTHDRGDEFGEIELYTRLTTITIDAPTLNQAALVARALRGVNLDASAHSPLPAPTQRTLTGHTRCVGKAKPTSNR